MSGTASTIALNARWEWTCLRRSQRVFLFLIPPIAGPVGSAIADVYLKVPSVATALILGLLIEAGLTALVILDLTALAVGEELSRRAHLVSFALPQGRGRMLIGRLSVALGGSLAVFAAGAAGVWALGGLLVQPRPAHRPRCSTRRTFSSPCRRSSSSSPGSPRPAPSSPAARQRRSSPGSLPAWWWRAGPDTSSRSTRSTSGSRCSFSSPGSGRSRGPSTGSLVSRASSKAAQVSRRPVPIGSPPKVARTTPAFASGRPRHSKNGDAIAPRHHERRSVTTYSGQASRARRSAKAAWAGSRPASGRSSSVAARASCVGWKGCGSTVSTASPAGPRTMPPEKAGATPGGARRSTTSSGGRARRPESVGCSPDGPAGAHPLGQGGPRSAPAGRSPGESRAAMAAILEVGAVAPAARRAPAGRAAGSAVHPPPPTPIPSAGGSPVPVTACHAGLERPQRKVRPARR